MHTLKSNLKGNEPLHRYSAKKMAKPVNFFISAPDAKEVFVSGDFNEWNLTANNLKKQPDGNWHAQLPLNHGHHHYVFLVDGKRVLDPRASGVGRDQHNERVSLLAVS